MGSPADYHVRVQIPLNAGRFLQSSGRECLVALISFAGQRAGCSYHQVNNCIGKAFYCNSIGNSGGGLTLGGFQTQSHFNSNKVECLQRFWLTQHNLAVESLNISRPIALDSS